MKYQHSELTNRFLVAYNQIDAAMRKHTRILDDTVSFSEVAEKFSEKMYFSDMGFIRVAAKLRNVLVHEKKDHSQELATPVEKAVQEMERIANELNAPEKVDQRFQRNVEAVSPTDTIKKVLQLVAEHGFSQFPVLSEEGEIVGLLTENGITRWLSPEVCKESMIEFEEVKVHQIMAHEESRENMQIVGRHRLVNDIRKLFSDKNLLEAAIITQTGKKTEKPIGIITRWDLISNE